MAVNPSKARRLLESLDQLRDFRARRVNAYSAEFKAWAERTHRTLADAFGASQYLRGFGNLHFCEPRVHMVRWGGSSEPEWLPMDQARFDSDCVTVEQLLRDAIEDLGGGTTAKNDGPWGLIHNRVAAVARKRFDDGHLADAVESAMKAVVLRVKAAWIAAGKPEEDGKSLMLSAFSVKNPVVRIADLSTQNGRDSQEGFMHLFAGAVQAIRNPKAHDFVTITHERALQYLVLASILMQKLDEVGAA